MQEVKRTAEQPREVRVKLNAAAAAVFESRGFERPEHAAQVEKIKTLAAVLHSELNDIAIPPGNTEAGRLVSLAKTDLESSVMWAVKAVSRYSPSKNL